MYYSPKQFNTVIKNLVNAVVTLQFSAYADYFNNHVTWETIYKEDGDGYLVMFRVDGSINEHASFTYLNGSDRDLEAYVREAVVRIIGLSNI